MAKEMFDNCERLKAKKPKDKLNQWLDENAGWHEDEERNWEKSYPDKVTPGPIYVPFSKIKEYMADDEEEKENEMR